MTAKDDVELEETHHCGINLILVKPENVVVCPACLEIVERR